MSIRRHLWSREVAARMGITFMMGFSCGLPLLLTLTLLQAWMKALGVDLSLIGLMSLVGLPYTLKFLWAPFVDRYVPPFLGRRRGWLLMAQIGIVLAIIALGWSDPVRYPLWTGWTALLVSFFSATQDIVVDAYRREHLPTEELGLGSAVYVNGYRLAMLFSSGGGLILADHLSFPMVYTMMAACMVPGILTTLLAPEPPTESGVPKSLREAVIEPLRDFFQKPLAIWILSFILLYKIGDTMANAMTIPFYLDLGFSKTEIGAVVKLFGFWATLVGSVVGGMWLLKIGIMKGLWVFGFLQAISTAGFSLLAVLGPVTAMLAAVVVVENLTGGMGTAAYTAYMAQMTNKRFTATQYALLSSLMGVPRVIASAPTGYMAEASGWPWFFLWCTAAAVPGLIVLYVIGKRSLEPLQ
uniref:MFS transporter n=1 Tax=Desulfatirhabdium butyrativorans TaxID=340467 RepID=A0A7C4RT31_9BACT